MLFAWAFLFFLWPKGKETILDLFRFSFSLPLKLFDEGIALQEIENSLNTLLMISLPLFLGIFLLSIVVQGATMGWRLQWLPGIKSNGIFQNFFSRALHFLIKLFFLTAAFFLLPQKIVIFSWGLCFSYALFGGMDFLFEHYRFKRNLKMSREEMQEEIRNASPAFVPSKSVLETGNIWVFDHDRLAILLFFDASSLKPPICLYKLAGEKVNVIRKNVKKRQVALVENSKFANALNQLAKVGQRIPKPLYEMAASTLTKIVK